MKGYKTYLEYLVEKYPSLTRNKAKERPVSTLHEAFQKMFGKEQDEVEQTAKALLNGREAELRGHTLPSRAW